MLCVVRSATTLHRLLDALPVFAGDHRVTVTFTLVPGSRFDADAFAALEGAGARTIPWDEAVTRHHDLAIAASPNGALHLLRPPLALLPHGAGYGKPPGLDPARLLRLGKPIASLHALAHPSQLARLAHASPAAAEPAVVTGDPTLERLRESLPRRDRYREALGTGHRRLIVLTSTWGPHSLFARHPGLPLRLVTGLPCDAYQVALVLHPNEHVRHGPFVLAQWLDPALRAGLLLARPHQEWAAVLTAADLVVTDHGSTALYAAALDLPLLAACDGGGELIPGSPMDTLLRTVPRLETAEGTPLAGQLDAALAAHRPGASRRLAEPAFAAQGRALDLLRAELYRLLALDPPLEPPVPEPLPDPVTRPRPVAAHSVLAEADGDEVRVERRPLTAALPPSGAHVAAEADRAALRQVLSAALLYRRAEAEDGWTARALADYPGCRTAAVILPDGRCLLRVRGGGLLSVSPRAASGSGGRVRPDALPAVLSAAYAWLTRRPGPPPLPATLRCLAGPLTIRVQLSEAAGGTSPGETPGEAPGDGCGGWGSAPARA